MLGSPFSGPAEDIDGNKLSDSEEVGEGATEQHVGGARADRNCEGAAVRISPCPCPVAQSYARRS